MAKNINLEAALAEPDAESSPSKKSFLSSFTEA